MAVDPIAEAVAAERSSPASTETDPTNNYRGNLGHDRCYACGGIHGGVNQAIWCLQVHLRQMRGLVGRCRELATSLSGVAVVFPDRVPSNPGPLKESDLAHFASLLELLALLLDQKGAR